MSSLVNYGTTPTIQIVSPDPTGAGGLAIQNDLKAIVDHASRGVGELGHEDGVPGPAVLAGADEVEGVGHVETKRIEETLEPPSGVRDSSVLRITAVCVGSRLAALAVGRGRFVRR